MIKAKVKNFFDIKDTPHNIAAGAALGVFWGIMPGEGLGTAIVTATMFKLNRMASIAGVMSTNVWSTLATMPLALFIASQMFDKQYTELAMNAQQFKNISSLFTWEFGRTILFDFIIPLATSFFIISTLVSAPVYVGVRLFLKKKRSKSLSN